MRKKTKKLNYIKVRLFFCKIRKKIIIYKLELFKNAKVHFIFYFLLLKLADFKTPIQDIPYYQV